MYDDEPPHEICQHSVYMCHHVCAIYFHSLVILARRSRMLFTLGIVTDAALVADRFDGIEKREEDSG
jgi:hypothetical protein